MLLSTAGIQALGYLGHGLVIMQMTGDEVIRGSFAIRDANGVQEILIWMNLRGRFNRLRETSRSDAVSALSA